MACNYEDNSMVENSNIYLIRIKLPPPISAEAPGEGGSVNQLHNINAFFFFFFFFFFTRRKT
jgi:hypothetical protein